jgi:hypothetical protein
MNSEITKVLYRWGLRSRVIIYLTDLPQRGSPLGDSWQKLGSKLKNWNRRKGPTANRASCLIQNEGSGTAPQKYSRGSPAHKRGMKNLIPVYLTGATITVGITTALVQSKGLTWHALWARPYVYGYAAAGVMLLFAVATAIHAGKQESNKIADEKHKQIKTRLAILMRQWQEIFTSLKAATNDNGYTELIKNAMDWANEAETLLKEAGHPTDAELLSQVGHLELSSEQLARSAHIPEWKRSEVARFLLYYQTLDQIRSNRRY